MTELLENITKSQLGAAMLFNDLRDCLADADAVTAIVIASEIELVAKLANRLKALQTAIEQREEEQV